jgi:hypothetical protein
MIHESGKEGGVVEGGGVEHCRNMPFFKKRKSSKKKELENNLQERVTYMQKRVQYLEEIVEAIRHGRITELKLDTQETQDMKIQVEDNESGRSRSHPEKVNGHHSGMDTHQVDMAADCEVTVDVHRVDIKEEEEGLKQTGNVNSVEETLLGCVESVNGQDKLEQIGEAKCVQETLLAHEEGIQAEDSGMEAETPSHQIIYIRRIRRIGVCVLKCAVRILLGGLFIIFVFFIFSFVFFLCPKTFLWNLSSWVLDTRD